MMRHLEGNISMKSKPMRIQISIKFLIIENLRLVGTL